MEKLPVFLQGIQNIGVLDISTLQQVWVRFQYAKLIPINEGHHSEVIK